MTCPYCNSKVVLFVELEDDIEIWECLDCGYQFRVVN